ncbi:MAG: response regulator transcription factor [Chloroflexota bacterium]
MTAIRIIIVDDHPVVREGLRGMLSAQPDLDVVGEADDGVAGVALIAQLQPDVVLMDLRMPGGDGVSAIRAIQAKNLQSHVIVLTTYDNDGDIVTAIEAGATGYLLKDTPRETLFQAIRAASRGESILAPTVAAKLMSHLRKPAQETLSTREVDVLKLVSEGLSNKQISRQLHISEATVKTHLIHIFNKLDVDDRTAAVMVALKRGILHLNLDGQS